MDEKNVNQDNNHLTKRGASMKKILFMITVLAELFLTINGSLATTTYYCSPIADTRLDAAVPNTNFGEDTTLRIAGTAAGGPVRSIIRFNIPPFVAASQIESAYLKIYVGSGGSTSLGINIHPVTPPDLWFEKDLFKPDTTQIVWGASWNECGGTASGLAWATAGGDYDAGAYASATIVGGWRTVDITALLSNHLDTIRKYGVLLKLQDEALNAYKNVYSRDSATYQPYLELNADLGLPATTFMCPALADTYIDESLVDGEHDLNFNWKTRVLVSRHATYGRARGLWRFEIDGYSAESITCAKLFLSGSERAFRTRQFAVDCYALDVPLNEEQATWDESESGVPWTSPGGDYDASVFSSGTIYQTLLGDPAYNWRAEIDLTELVVGNLEKVKYNGILMKLQDETGENTNQNMASREAYDDSDVATYLLIDIADTDGDAVGDGCDNCPNDANTGQEDNEQDGLGDVCDADDDNDALLDDADNCPLIANPAQEDEDSDGKGNVCDNCSSAFNPGQEDTLPPQGNDCGDACECEGNFDGDQDVDSSDAATLKKDFGRSNLINPCPVCTTIPWCIYP
jgi:hypothetical protein